MIIIGLLMTISTRVYYTEKDRFEYNNSLTKILSLINTARNYAISSSPIYIGGKAFIPTSGYGVYINLEPQDNDPHFTVFASRGNDDDDEKTFNTKYDEQLLTGSDTVKDYIIETYRLPKQMDLQYFIFNEDGKTPTAKWNNKTETPIAKEAVIMFRPPLAESYLGNNKDKKLEELGIRFYNINAVKESPKACQTININRIKAFPEITYSDCGKDNI